MTDTIHTRKVLGELYGPIGSVRRGDDGLPELCVDESAIAHLSEMQQFTITSRIKQINEDIRDGVDFVDLNRRDNIGMRAITGVSERDLDQLEGVIPSRTDGSVLMSHVPVLMEKALRKIHGGSL